MAALVEGRQTHHMRLCSAELIYDALVYTQTHVQSITMFILMFYMIFFMFFILNMSMCFCIIKKNLQLICYMLILLISMFLLFCKANNLYLLGWILSRVNYSNN